MTNNAPIGVFDSGVGGLTVVREIIRQIPNESIIYFGDTARVPYGSKSQKTILTYTREIVKFLLSKEVKAIVVACNTASALALETVKQEVTIPIIGVVEPGAKAAREASKNGSIGVIGTEGTIQSGIYNKLLGSMSGDIKVYGKACPLFVPLVEEGWLNDDVITEQVVRRYLDELLEYDIDTLVLGCTHYPLLRKVIGKVVGEKVNLVNPAYETAKSLKEVLTKNHLCGTHVSPKHKFYVSDGANKFQKFANSILPLTEVETQGVTTEYLSEISMNIDRKGQC